MKKKDIYTDWLPKKNEMGKDGNAIPHFEDGGGAYKKRVFPQFTRKNLKKRFNKEIFLKELIMTKDHRDNVKLALSKALNGDPELTFAFDYDELLPEYNFIVPLYTSGSIFNFLDKDLSFITIFRSSSVIVELGESFSTAFGVLLDKKLKKGFLLKYSSNRDGTADCYFERLVNFKNFKKDINNDISKKVIEDLKYLAPDDLILNKDFKFNIKKIIKILKPLAKKKRKDVMLLVKKNTPEYLLKKKLQKKTGTYIFSLNTDQINNQISLSKMDGSIQWIVPRGKDGKPNMSADPKVYPGSNITIKADHFV